MKKQFHLHLPDRFAPVPILPEWSPAAGCWAGDSSGDGSWNDGGWNDGPWNDGGWGDGSWHDGGWNDGPWNDGGWGDGPWNDGPWNDGSLVGGIADSISNNWKGNLPRAKYVKMTGPIVPVMRTNCKPSQRSSLQQGASASGQDLQHHSASASGQDLQQQGASAPGQDLQHQGASDSEAAGIMQPMAKGGAYPKRNMFAEPPNHPPPANLLEGAKEEIKENWEWGRSDERAEQNLEKPTGRKKRKRRKVDADCQTENVDDHEQQDVDDDEQQAEHQQEHTDMELSFDPSWYAGWGDWKKRKRQPRPPVEEEEMMEVEVEEEEEEDEGEMFEDNGPEELPFWCQENQAAPDHEQPTREPAAAQSTEAGGPAAAQSTEGGGFAGGQLDQQPPDLVDPTPKLDGFGKSLLVGATPKSRSAAGVGPRPTKSLELREKEKIQKQPLPPSPLSPASDANQPQEVKSSAAAAPQAVSPPWACQPQPPPPRHLPETTMSTGLLTSPPQPQPCLPLAPPTFPLPGLPSVLGSLPGPTTLPTVLQAAPPTLPAPGLQSAMGSLPGPTTLPAVPPAGPPSWPVVVGPDGHMQCMIPFNVVAHYHGLSSRY